MKTITSYVNAALFVVCITFFNLSFGQNPGNIGDSDLQLWMKADAGTSTTTNNQDVTTWLDNSPNAFTATVGGTNAPRFMTDVINFNPAIQFNTARSQRRYFKIPLAAVTGTGLDITPSPDVAITNPSSMSIFAAFLTDGSGAGTMFSRATSSSRSYQLWLGDRDRVVHYTLARTSGTGQSDPNSGINYGIVHARNDAKISSVTIDINTTMAADPNTNKILRYVNGYLDPLTVHTDGDAGFGTGETTNMDVLIGARRNGSNTDTGNELVGNVAELIVYDRALTPAERQKVETYMAIKYGITLGYNDEYYRWENNPLTTTTFGYSGTSNDYILSNNSYAWTGSDNAGYGFNVFGIARDDDSGLLQLKSKSVHVEEITKNTSVITMTDESNSIADDRSYLLVGNNGDQVMLQSTTVPERISQTINRIWKARRSTNNVGTVRLAFDLSQFTIPDADANELELIISKNSDLTNYKSYVGTYYPSIKTIAFDGVSFEDAEYFTLAKLEELQDSYHFAFNGSSKYIDLGDNFDLTGNFTISAWIKRDGNNDISILSKRNAADTQGYEFKIDASGNLEMYWYNGVRQSLVSDTNIPTGKWHHVAAIYNGTLTLYVDGVRDKAQVKLSPVATAHRALIGATGSTSPSKFWHGDIDELRIWNTALSEDQMRYIINQEIEATSGAVSGSYFKSRGVTPTKDDIGSVSWNNLIGYFPFSHVRGNCLFNESSYTNRDGRLYNTPNSSIEGQTAPLPYKSLADGSWDTSGTWLNGNVQNIPGHVSVKDFTTQVDWNIVEINHNITMSNFSLPTVDGHNNRTLLALFVDSNKLTVDGSTGVGHGLTVTHCLNLDGSIDLNGESQLIQTVDSDLMVGNSASLEKDQQGTKDLYTYNYWSSPVGTTKMPINDVTHRYKLPEILRNGTNPTTPTAITFVNGYDGAVSGSNISIATYWIWKFANQASDDYSQWQYVGNTGDILPGQGYTMKGVQNTFGSVAQEQNYVFTGKPNNGDINLDLSANNDYLVGNPYPSAMDAEQFIIDNGPTIEGTGNTTGTLYFWEHWGGGSHVLAEYQGGYATYNLSGGVPTATLGTIDPDVDQTGALIGTKIPGRYIPVGQGFFVIGENTGKIKFNNGQRVFRKEGNSTSVFMRNDGDSNTEDASAYSYDERLKIRLGFNSVNSLHRQILITVDERATMDYDWGFDGKLNEDQMDDMYWMIDEEKYVIQGINDIVETETVLPLGLITAAEGENSITIDELENIPIELPIYLHDIELGVYHNLRESDYSMTLPAGEHLDRFEIVFSTPDALSIDDAEVEQLSLYYALGREKIVIFNPKNLKLKGLEAYNIIGQSVYTNNQLWEGTYGEYELQNLSTGTYIIKLYTENNKAITKKIIVK
jgi:putative surface-exposed virulence protein